MVGDISFDMSDGQHMFIITDKQSTDGNRENSDILEKDFVQIEMIHKTRMYAKSKSFGPKLFKIMPGALFVDVFLI